MDSSQIKISSPLPFLKWAGGKRWLPQFLSIEMPISGTYFEPFLGSAALFFHLSPRRAVLSDSNRELIDTYRAIKNDWQLVHRYLLLHRRRHSTKHYYRVRDFAPRSAAARAARFIYLNRTCWNGLYRVNRKGKFNVPKGTKNDVFLSTDDFESVSRALKSAALQASDFEKVVDQAKSGDFIFADPPYTVRHNLNGFIKYNDRLFSWTDQVRLRDALLRASRRGARIFMTNADHASVRELYAGLVNLETVARYSAISSTKETRGRFTELLMEMK